MGQGARRERVANAMRSVLVELIEREVRDPRVRAAGLVSVNQVELNRDMSVARVYVSFIGTADDAAEERALSALRAAAGFLRGPVGRRLRLQRAPELRFSKDERAAFGERIGQIVRDDERKSAAAHAGEAGADSDTLDGTADDAPDDTADDAPDDRRGDRDGG
ncbi:30S ribosome-binding factor RbfA [Haliangium sp.]|uniref:30S ribosome-binding factor RbfA n=1 Tax=Haliangium sp. TaxID=2663208 RepID=UPI003D10715F